MYQNIQRNFSNLSCSIILLAALDLYTQYVGNVSLSNYGDRKTLICLLKAILINLTWH